MKAARAIPEDVATAEQAIRAGAKVARVWADAWRARQELNRLHTIANALRSNAALPVAGGLRHYVPREYTARYPDRRIRWSPRHSPNTTVSLLADIDRGVEPALLSAAELERLADADRKRQKPEKHATARGLRRVPGPV